MKLALKIAWRFLMSAKKQTLLIILGIGVGVSVQVFIGALITGLQDSLVDKTIGSSSQITVESNDDYITTYLSDIEMIKQTSSDISIVSPTLNIGGFMTFDENKKEVLLRGLDLTTSEEIYDFEGKLYAGDLPENDNEVLLGLGLHDSLEIFIDDEVTIEIQGELKTLTVSGFFDFGISAINESWAITSLSTLQTILNTSGVNQIEMQLSKVFEAENIANMLVNEFDDNVTISNWMSDNADLLSGLQGQSASSLMIQVFVIISVVLGIASTLAITVMQKSRQLGILKAMGLTDGNASKVFVSEGFFLGVFGAIAGIIIGIGLLLSFTMFALNPDGTPLIPLTIDPLFILLSASIAVVASVIASLIPAIKSSKLTVIEVIRNA
ncbi:MAG: FtsX-like permease family protein [Acholeplasmataceae bacterium]